MDLRKAQVKVSFSKGDAGMNDYLYDLVRATYVDRLSNAADKRRVKQAKKARQDQCGQR
jgi:hypothetical protein